ncbi:Nramp family divalent metal transporter [Caldalkalibacillus salinus]|uniref:Nramp family divalent metal transporter n=1 Tax=Caldalkalibacillus salinus TaxID=2803787 RepID=UPI00192100F8|nr:Nramp family divalent metal transporter [Caldalkalibacillus salinus]
MTENRRFIDKLRDIGPAAIVTAAFIGPGTVTTASRTGASFGFTLLWALLFSIIATIILQEMSSRLGIVARKQLGEAIREQFQNPILRVLTILLIISAVTIGSAAYETGNILGGALGLAAITGMSVNTWGPIIGITAGLLLFFGSYKFIEKVFVVLVTLMSIVFVITAIVIRPDFSAILSGTFVPSIPDGAILFAIALIGTTVVPYNLFLHSSTVQERWNGPEGLKQSRFDTVFTILLGGLISMAIVVTAAVAFPLGTDLSDAGEMAKQLEPVLGSWATYFFALGLLSAGITSCISAPLAAAYATAGALGWERNLKSTRFRAVWGSIILIGVIFSGIGYNPTEVILFAQYANGLLLPVIAIFLLYVMNNKTLLGEYVNRFWTNLIGGIIVLVTILLALRSFGVLDFLFG